MKFLLGIATYCLCLSSTLCGKDEYRAGIVEVSTDNSHAKYAAYIHDAAKSNVDILVLPHHGDSEGTHFAGPDNYDEITKTISSAARQAGIYVVAHLYEKTWCQDVIGLIRSNLVFDRQGAIVAEYRKPVTNIANCTTASSSEAVSFTTDLGVTFGLLMEEDMILKNLESLKFKNYVVVGAWSSAIPFLTAGQFSSSWAFMTNVNLVSSTGIYAGKSGSSGVGTANNIIFADLAKEGGSEQSTPPMAHPVKRHTFPREDLSQYTIRPVNLEASVQGYSDFVCSGKFCCDFYIQANFVGPKQSEVSYGLAVFDGIRNFGNINNIGTQCCAIFASVGLYKRTSAIELETNSTYLQFNKIKISANFPAKNTGLFPIIQLNNNSPVNNFRLHRDSDKNTQKVNMEVVDSQDLLTFGIFVRDYSNDFEIGLEFNKENKTDTVDIYEYIYNEDVQEFFDYVWIRLRILIVVVSIYILEMM